MTVPGNRDNSPWLWRGGQVNHSHHGEALPVTTLNVLQPLECNNRPIAAEKWWWIPASQTC